MNNHKIGFFIPNSDFNFTIKRIINRYNLLFVITTHNEIIVFDVNENEYTKKFLLLTNTQERENILEIFIVEKAITIMDNSENVTDVIITINEGFVINFWSIKSGRCINKINLRRYCMEDNLLDCSVIHSRFLSLIFTKKIIIFDVVTQMILYKENFTFEEKNITLKESSILTALKIKENKFFCQGNLGLFYKLEIVIPKVDANSFSKDSSFNSDESTRIELDEYDKDKFPSYSSYLEYKMKLSRVNNTDKRDNNSPNKKLGSKDVKQCMNIINSLLHYDFDKLDVIFQKISFNPIKKIGINVSQYISSQNYQYSAFVDQQNLKVVFLDSIDELSVIAQKSISFSKLNILFIGEFISGKNIYFIIIYENLLSDIFYYDDKVRELKIYAKYNLMLLDNSVFKYRFMTKDNTLFVYYKTEIFIYNFELDSENLLKLKDNFHFDVSESIINRTHESTSQYEERYCDFLLDLRSIFTKKLYFNNYFKDNFKEIKGSIMNDLNSGYDKFSNLNKNNNTKLQSNISRKDSFESITNRDFIFAKNLFKITSSLIFYNSEDMNLYYIIGFNYGKIMIFDCFFNKNLEINPYIEINHHKSKIIYLQVYQNETLIAASDDGQISFTDISSSTLTSQINLFKQNITKSENSFKIEIFPIKYHSYYYPLKQVKNCVLLDNNSFFQDEGLYSKSKTNLALIFEDNTSFIINMNSFKTIFNFSMNTKEIIGVYLSSINRVVMFLLYDYSLKICSINSRHMDRVIKDPELIYKILKVEESLKVHFNNPHKILINDYDPIYTKTNLDKYVDKATDYMDFNNKHKKNNDIKLNLNEFNEFREDVESEIKLKETSTQKLGFSLTVKHKLLNLYSNNKECNLVNFTETSKVFMTKYFMNLMDKDKLNLNLSMNKFDSYWIKSIEGMIIDKVNIIVNDLNKNNKVVEKETFDENEIIDGNYSNNSNINYYSSNKADNCLNRLKILNLINYPSKHMLQPNNTINDANFCGIESMNLLISGQLYQGLQMNFEDFFVTLEKIYHQMKNKKTFMLERNNIFNFLALLRIWHISVDQDLLFVENFKIFSPILEFNIMIFGSDNSLTIFLNEENSVSGGPFTEHFSLFKNSYINSDELKRKSLKENKIFDKRHVVNYYSGYCVNFKNYTLSGDVSHILNIFYFGSLMSILGYEEGDNLTKIISIDKMLLRSLSLQNYIKFSNLDMPHHYMFEGVDSTTIANKDIIIVDYFLMKLNEDSKTSNKPFVNNKIPNLSRNSRISSLNTSSNINSNIIANNISSRFSIKVLNNSSFQNVKIKSQNLSLFTLINNETNNFLNIISPEEFKRNPFYRQINSFVNYLNSLYMYVFDLSSLEDYQSNLSIKSVITMSTNLNEKKEKFISELDILIVYIVLQFQNLSTKTKLPEIIIDRVFHLLILFVIKTMKDNELKSKYSKVVVELLSKSSQILEKSFGDSPVNLLKLLLELYTSIKIPIDLELLFKKYEIGNCIIIKSEDNLNFLKIMIAKIIKTFTKPRVNVFLKMIIDDFTNYTIPDKSFLDIMKKKSDKENNQIIDTERFNYLLELVWILFKDKNTNNVGYLPSLVNLLMSTISPQKKELKTSCMDSCKKILSSLISNYNMVAFHQNTQRLAVGANDGKVFIYDLTSGSMWKTLIAHNYEISALSFDFSGNIIITYSGQESCVKFWKVSKI